MTDYQMNLVIDTYFNVLINKGIKETTVKDMYQKNGELHIVLENETIITEKIKNYIN